MTIRDYARLIMPHLVQLARNRETIPYGALANRIGRHHRPIPRALGLIRDEWCSPKGLPLINVSVVNKDTLLPGESFLAEGTSHLTRAQYRHRFEQIREEVFAYRQWDAALGQLELSPL